MFEIGGKQWCPHSCTLFGLYIDEFETYMDKINKDFLCLYNPIVIILLKLMMFLCPLIQEQTLKTCEQVVRVLDFL